MMGHDKNDDGDSKHRLERHSEAGIVETRCKYTIAQYHSRVALLKFKVSDDGFSPLAERHMLVCKGGIMIAVLSSVYGWEHFYWENPDGARRNPVIPILFWEMRMPSGEIAEVRKGKFCWRERADNFVFTFLNINI